jgi:hypothetical protein
LRTPRGHERCGFHTPNSSEYEKPQSESGLLAPVSVSKPKGCETAGRISDFRGCQRFANLSLNWFASRRVWMGPFPKFEAWGMSTGHPLPCLGVACKPPHPASGRPREEGGYRGSGQLTKAAGDVSPDVERACPAHDLPGKRAAADPDHTCNAFKHAEAPA